MQGWSDFAARRDPAGDLSERLAELFVEAAALHFARLDRPAAPEDALHRTARLLASAGTSMRPCPPALCGLADGLDDVAGIAEVRGAAGVAACLRDLACALRADSDPESMP